MFAYLLLPHFLLWRWFSWGDVEVRPGLPRDGLLLRSKLPLTFFFFLVFKFHYWYQVYNTLVRHFYSLENDPPQLLFLSSSSIPFLFTNDKISPPLLKPQQRLLLPSPGRTHLQDKATARKITAQTHLPLPLLISPSFPLLLWSSSLTPSTQGHLWEATGSFRGVNDLWCEFAQVWRE